MWSLTSILRLDTLLGAAVLAYQTLLELPWVLFCFPTHEWCCIPPVPYSQTNCVHAKYNMIILVEIEPAECHSDPYWYSLSGGGDQILKVILVGLTVCAQTHLMRPEVPAQCFNMDFVPSKNISNDWGGAQWTFHRSRAVEMMPTSVAACSSLLRWRVRRPRSPKRSERNLSAVLWTFSGDTAACS